MGEHTNNTALDADYDNAADTVEDEAQDFDTLDEAATALELGELSFDDGDEVIDEPAAEDTTEEVSEETTEEVTPEDAEEVTEELSEEDAATVTLDDGTETTVSELKKGYFRHKDYIAKTTEIATERKALEEERSVFGQSAQSLETAYATLAQTLEGLIPAEPDLQLAQSNPSQYQYQMALRNNAIAELQGIMNQAGQATQVSQEVSQEDFNRYKTSEEAKLIKQMPGLSDPGKMTAFRSSVVKSATEDFGFTEQEATQTYDARILRAIHFAKIGLKADHNRQNAKRRIGEKPRKSDAKAAVRTGAGSKAAMQKLKKTGSIEDAMSIDFE